ncbi:hypothetical protein [Mycolicibacterium hodleri]|uniref:hypothetical protein n=1 Tax=Mycolicibacterium hodleri TaxID=49897 RepID=UPI0013763C90|nr:hypothetical protein [Mycolicibacterium hodleri]
MTDTDDDPNAFPTEWGYRPAPTGAVEAAFDVFASSMSDDEFTEFVARVRPVGGR